MSSYINTWIVVIIGPDEQALGWSEDGDTVWTDDWTRCYRFANELSAVMMQITYARACAVSEEAIPMMTTKRLLPEVPS